MDIQAQPMLKLGGVDFVDIKLNTTSSYDQKTPINLQINPKVFFPEEDKNSFKIIMDVDLICESLFNLKILAIGTFELSEEVTTELKKSFVNVNAPAIMFPYIRSFVSTLTSNLGNVTGHILIPTQLFQGELEEINAPKT